MHGYPPRGRLRRHDHHVVIKARGLQWAGDALQRPLWPVAYVVDVHEERVVGLEVAARERTSERCFAAEYCARTFRGHNRAEACAVDTPRAYTLGARSVDDVVLELYVGLLVHSFPNAGADGAQLRSGEREIEVVGVHCGPVRPCLLVPQLVGSPRVCRLERAALLDEPLVARLVHVGAPAVEPFFRKIAGDLA